MSKAGLTLSSTIPRVRRTRKLSVSMTSSGLLEYTFHPVLGDPQTLCIKVTARLAAVAPNLGRQGRPFDRRRTDVAPQGMAFELLHFGIFHLGLMPDGDVRIGVAPECKKDLESSLSLCFVASHGIGSSEL